MTSLDEPSGSDFLQRYNPVFINTNLNTALALIVSDFDTVSDLKKRLLLEHPVSFPEVGDIKISALKVKRRGQLYHLPDSMLVKKAFAGLSNSWYLFAEVIRVEGQNDNLQLQRVDFSQYINCQTSGVEPSKGLPDVDDKSNLSPEKDQHVKSKSSAAYLSERPNDAEMEAEKDTTDIQDVPFSVTDSRLVENVAVDHQKVSATAADHNCLDPKPPEKSENHAVNLELLDGGDVDNKPTKEGAPVTEVTKKRKRSNAKRKNRSADDHEQSHSSMPVSATDCHEKVSSNLVEACANVVGNGNIEFDQPEHKLASDHLEVICGLTSMPAVDMKKKRKKSLKNLNHPPAATTSPRDLVGGTGRLGVLVEVKTDAAASAGNANHDGVVSESCASLPREMLDDSLTSALDKEIRRGEKNADDVGNGKVTRNAVDYLQTTDLGSKGRKEGNGDEVAGLEEESEFPMKDDTEAMAKRDDGTINTDKAEPANFSKGKKKTEKGKNEDQGTLVTSCVQRVEGLGTGTTSTEPIKLIDGKKPIERVKENDDDVGTGNAILRAANNLLTADLGSKRRKEVNVDEVSSLEKEGEFPMKDDTEAMANRDDGKINTDEAKPAKSSKVTKKSKKAKNPDQGALATSSMQHGRRP